MSPASGGPALQLPHTACLRDHLHEVPATWDTFSMAQAAVESGTTDDKDKPLMPFGISYLPITVRVACTRTDVAHTSLMDALSVAVAKPLRRQSDLSQSSFHE